MNEFLIQLQAILDKETSKGNINKSIERIQNQINKLKIQAEIEPKSILTIKKQLEQITNQKITFSNIGIDQGQIGQVGEQVGKAVAASAKKAVDNSRINTDKLNADIRTLQEQLQQFRFE